MAIKMRYFILLTAAALLSGCVERKLTIVTQPSEAVVWLNDEEIGTTPVTVNFNWYGDYYVRIEKAGCEILNTHRPLARPLHDRFPLDFVAEVVWPGKIVDHQHWEFELEPFRQKSPEQLVEAASEMRQRTSSQIGQTATEILTQTKK